MINGAKFEHLNFFKKKFNAFIPIIINGVILIIYFFLILINLILYIISIKIIIRIF